VLVVCIGLAGGRAVAWPFIAWPMYAGGYPGPPEQVSDVQLRLLGRDGCTMAVTAPEVFGHVEIALGREVIARAFEDGPERAAYRDVVLRRLRPLLVSGSVTAVQGWRLRWEVRPLELPPIDLARPTGSELLGRIQLPVSESARTPEAGAAR
jgi:hypothetical protein